MVRINRVYTRKGDGGNTSLVGGRSVPKNDLRVESFGSVDEVNCLIGLARSFNAQKPSGTRRDALERILLVIQHRLFDLGAELATHPEDTYEGQIHIEAKDVTWLEEVIDAMNAELEDLKSFVLPGGGTVTSFLHQARAVCRRAERITTTLAAREAVGPQVLAYLNRLSDALFVFSRWVTATLDEPETLWEPGISADASWRW